MSLKILSPSTRPAIRNICLSNVARLKASYSQSSNLQQEPRQSPDQASDSKHAPPKDKQKPGGSYTRVVASFAIGFPLGYGIHRWNENRKGIKIANPGDFVRYTLIEKEYISPTSSIFTLYPSGDSVLDFSNPQWERAIASVEFKQPQLQIARWYTLLPRVEGQEEHELRFLIRKEQNGEVSGYLHRLPEGADIELRGPAAEYVLPEKVDSIVFLAGGTGIAPAMQVADRLAGRTEVKILWANRRREDCLGGVSDHQYEARGSMWNPLSWIKTSNTTTMATPDDGRKGAIVAQLDDIRQRATPSDMAVNIDYYIDEEGTFIRPEQVQALVKALSISREGGAGPGTKLLFVSGPEGFIKYWAGAKRWVNGVEVQGPLGGILASMSLQGWEIVKL